MLRIAIIGTGIAGLGAAHFLHRDSELTLFEKNAHAGGHTNTVTVEEDGQPVPIDTGFMVFNKVTYPNLVRLFQELEVEIQPTDMSFSVQHRPSQLEYNGGSLSLLFGQRRNLWNPRHWKMLLSIHRFNQEAVPALEDPRWTGLSLREYVGIRGYGRDMLERYLIPMASAVWSSPPDQIETFPAATLLRFWHNHGFLGLQTQHPWWTVRGGAQRYVQKLTAPFADRIRKNCRVVRIKRAERSVELHFQDGPPETFDKVVLASHADQSMSLLDSPTALEERLLPQFRYQTNTATLHSDPSVMPSVRRCWAAWNYRTERPAGQDPVASTHYWMNRLQGVSQTKPYFVSLNYADRIDPAKVHRNIVYEHPLFDLPAVEAQKELPSLNHLHPGQTTYYAGAWFRYGFHEDGFTSGLECARALTGRPIWSGA